MQQPVVAQIIGRHQAVAPGQIGGAERRDGFPCQPVAGKARPVAGALLDVQIKAVLVERIIPHG